MKKGLVLAAVATAMVLSIASTAFAAKKAPKVYKENFVGVIEDGDFYYADPATSLIPIRNLKYDAKILDVEVKDCKQLKVQKKAYGAYYLGLCVNKYIVPGKVAKVTFVVKQNDTYYTLKTNVVFQRAASPFTNFIITGEYDDEVVTYTQNFANEYIGCDSADFDRPKSLDEAFIGVGMADNQKLKGIYLVFENGCEKKIKNGNRYDLTHVKKIEVEFETKEGILAHGNTNYFKEETGSYTGKKRFPVKKCYVLNVADKETPYK
jgi:hypothetical protein